MREENGTIRFSRKERRAVNRREMSGRREDDPIIPKRIGVAEIAPLLNKLIAMNVELEESAPQYVRSMSDRYAVEGEQRAEQSAQLTKIIGDLAEISIRHAAE